MRRMFCRLVLPLCLVTLCSCGGKDLEDRLLDLEHRTGITEDATGSLESRLSAVERRVSQLENMGAAGQGRQKGASRITAAEVAPAPPQVTSVVPAGDITPDEPLQYLGLPEDAPVRESAAPATQGTSVARQPEAQEEPRERVAPAPKPAAKPAHPPKKQHAPEPAKAKTPGTYDTALALYRQGHYAKAHDTFAAFIRQSPRSSLVANALYWQGECSYSQGQFDRAIMAFKDVVSRFPRHAKAPASLLKAGYAYERMQDMGNARFYWQILLDDYPKSAPARLARSKMGAS